MPSNPYETLGVKSNASQEEIKNAYRKQAKRLHPDLNPGNKQAEAKFKEINGAYESVGTEEARAKYDRGESDAQAQAQAHAQQQEYARSRQGPYYSQTQSAGGQSRYQQPFEGMDEDIFSSLFGRGGGAWSGGGPQRAQDENYTMTIDFKDSILGVEKEISLPTGKRLRVKIPPGIESGKKLRFAAQSADGKGNLYVEIQVTPSETFTRVGDHLEIEIPISISEAILGAEIKVPTLDGSVMLKIPSSVSSGQKLRVAGKGVRDKGDQLVKIKIVSPPAKENAIDDELKASVEAWSRRHPFNPRETRGAT